MSADSNHFTDQQAEVDRNYQQFQTEVDALVATDIGRFALYRNASRVVILDTFRDAIEVGELTGGLPYSVQQITTEPVYVF